MYRNMQKERGWLDQLEPSWPIVAYEDDEPRNQIGESVIVAVKNVARQLNALNQPDEKKYLPFAGPQTITQDLLRTGAMHVNEIKTSRNNPGFLKVGASWRDD